jgi:hypothetical protein
MVRAGFTRRLQKRVPAWLGFVKEFSPLNSVSKLRGDVAAAISGIGKNRRIEYRLNELRGIRDHVDAIHKPGRTVFIAKIDGNRDDWRIDGSRPTVFRPVAHHIEVPFFLRVVLEIKTVRVELPAEIYHGVNVWNSIMGDPWLEWLLGGTLPL